MAGGKVKGVDIGLLILRIGLAGIMVTHGVVKLLPPNTLKGFSDYVSSLGLPGPVPPNLLAIAAITAEIGGGLLVFLGILPRIGALAVAAVLGVAIWKVHYANGFLLPLEMKEPGRVPIGWEFCAALLAMALAVVFAGGGKISIFPAKAGGPKPPPPGK